MYAIVCRQLRMEGNGKHVALASGNRMTVDFGKNLDARTMLDDPRSPDENSAQRPMVTVEAAHG